jgi:ribosomal protein S18 acetylase RimI-like enzyme
MLTAYAKREEIPEIAAFIDSTWRAAYRHILAPHFLNKMSVEERAAGLYKRFDDNASRFSVMRDDAGIAGASVFGKSFTDGYLDDGEVSAIYLRPDCIGKGYGHALFCKTEDALADVGYADIVLDVLSANERAVRFYTAHGYIAVDERMVKLGDEEYPLTVFRK